MKISGEVGRFWWGRPFMFQRTDGRTDGQTDERKDERKDGHGVLRERDGAPEKKTWFHSTI